MLLPAAVASVSFAAPQFSLPREPPLNGSEIHCAWTGRHERCTAADVPGAEQRHHPAELAASAPAVFDWNDYHGVALTTIDLNQHIPQYTHPPHHSPAHPRTHTTPRPGRYCGSCWAHAAFSTLADRIKIGRHLRGDRALGVPGSSRDVMPSVQAIINCGDAGSCSGGDSLAAFAWVARAGGVPPLTCQAYEARNAFNASSAACASGLALCRTCSATYDPARTPPFRTACAPVAAYPKVRVLAYGQLTAEADVVAEVLAHGPVVCHINARCLEPGVRSPTGVFAYNCTSHNHAVALAGWGVDAAGVRFWTVRNSWGVYFGDAGWFRIRRDPPNHWQPGEYGCNWVTPRLP